MNIPKLRQLRKVLELVALSRRKTFDINSVDCGTTACVAGWARRVGLCADDYGYNRDMMESFGLTEGQTSYLCDPPRYRGANKRNPRAAIKHLDRIIAGKVL